MITKLENIGFYTLTDKRARESSSVSIIKRAEIVLTDRCNFKCPYCRGVMDSIKGQLSLEKLQTYLNLLIDNGLENVRFTGGGEDYDYSCRARMFNYRSVGTTLAYIYHHWSSTFKAIQDQDKVRSLMMPELSWNHTNEKWGENFDIWGVRCSHEDCDEIMTTTDGIQAFCPKHPDSPYNMPESTTAEL